MKANSRVGLLVPSVYLFHSRKKCRRFMKKHLRWKATEFFDTSGQMFYDSGIAVILMEHKGKPETEMSLLVHEAYHAAVAHMQWLGEDAAGEETMSYLIQTITNGLFVAHEKWKRKHGRPSA